MRPPTLAERMLAVEHDLADLRRLIEGAIKDPESLPAGREASRIHDTAARERAELARRLSLAERELRALVRWASGGHG